MPITLDRRWLIGIDVPWATEVVSMNARSHWTNTHRQIQALRARGEWAARRAKPAMPKFTRAAVTVHMRFPDRRRRDLQNYHKTLKPLLDGFVDAGLLPDDDASHLIGYELRTWIRGNDEDVDSYIPLSEAGRPALSLVFDFRGTR